MEPSQHHPEITTIRDWLQVLFLVKGRILLVFLLTLLVAVASIYLRTEIYQAESKILIKLGREVGSPDPTVLKPSQMLITLSDSLINTEIQILKNRDLIARVVDRIGVDTLTYMPPPETMAQKIKHYLKLPVRKVKDGIAWLLDVLDIKKRLEPREALIEGIYNNLHCEPAQDTSMLIVRLAWPNPLLLPRIINELVDLYIERHLEARSTPKAYDLFIRQRNHLHRQLQDLEEELVALKNQWQLSDIDRQINMLSSDINRLSAEKDELRRKRRELQAVHDELKRQKASLPSRVVVEETWDRNPLLDALQERVRRLEDERQKLLLKFRATEPPVRNIEDRLRLARAALDREEREVLRRRSQGINPLRAGVEEQIFGVRKELEGIAARLEEVEELLASYQQRLALLNSRLPRLEDLEQRIDSLRKNVLLYDAKAEEARIMAIMDAESIANVAVVEPAAVPFRPFRPRKLLTLGIAVLLGVFLGLAVGFGSHALDRSILVQSHVEKAGLALVAMLPREDGIRARGCVAKEGAPPSPVFLAGLQAVARRCDGGRTVLVLGAEPGVGTSVVSCRLAALLGATKAVLHLRANPVDRSRPASSREEQGFFDLLERGAVPEPFQPPAVQPGLSCLAAGGSAGPGGGEKGDDPVSSSSWSRNLDRVLAGLLAGQDVLVIDGGVPLAHPFALELAQHADRIFVVAQWHRTRREVLADVQERLAAGGRQVEGVIVNQRQNVIPAWLYQLL